MKFARFRADGYVHSGCVEEKGLRANDGAFFPFAEVRWLPPVQPGKIIGLALNYREHADELGLQSGEQPIIFLKPDNTLTGHMEPVFYPAGSRFVHYEGELAVVIGKKARQVNSSSAMQAVGGYTVANDLTVRDYITNTFRPPIRAKGFDTFCPLGPWLVTTDEIQDPGELHLETRLNGRRVQEGDTSMFIHKIPEIIEFLSSFMTLYPGDVILTGTPRGIEAVRPGDVMDIEVEKVGLLSNTVAEERGPAV